MLLRSKHFAVYLNVNSCGQMLRHALSASRLGPSRARSDFRAFRARPGGGSTS